MTTPPTAHGLRPVLVAIFGFSIVSNMLILVAPIYMLQVFDRVLSSGSVDTLVWLTVVAVGLLAGGGALEVVRSVLLSRLRQRADDLGSARIEAELADPRRESDADTLKRDAKALRSFCSEGGLAAHIDAPWGLFFLGLLFLIHPWLGLIAAGGALVLVLLGALGAVLARRLSTAADKAHGRADRMLSMLGVGSEAGAMGLGTGLRAKWRRLRTEATDLELRARDRSDLTAGLARFVRTVVPVALTGTGAFLVLQEVVTPGVLIAASVLSTRALAPIETAAATWGRMLRALGAYRRLTAPLPTRQDQIQLPAARGFIDVQKLVGSAPGLAAPIIKGVSFSISAGEAVGIAGASRSGKSTLAALIAGVSVPASGQVRLDGAALGQWPEAQLAASIGYLPQAPSLFPGTVAENIARFADDRPERAVEAAERAQVHEVLLGLPEGYATEIAADARGLSGAEHQAICLARALFGAPQVLVLDEPEAGLDAARESALLEMIEAEKARGTTLVVVSQRTRVLGAMDRILTLDQGKIQHFSKAADVIAAGRRNVTALRAAQA